jgi:hypothetical protein
VPAGLHERRVGVGEIAEELAPPHPRATRKCLLRHDDGGLQLADLEVALGEPLSLGRRAGKRLRVARGGKRRKDESEQQGSQDGVKNH